MPKSIRKGKPKSYSNCRKVFVIKMPKDIRNAEKG